MSISDIDQKTAVMGIMGSLMAYMFYGRIQDASDIQSLQQVVVQLKGEQVDLWGKYNEDIKEKGELMFKVADYVIEQEIKRGEADKEMSRIELDNTKQWLEYYKSLQ